MKKEDLLKVVQECGLTAVPDDSDDHRPTIVVDRKELNQLSCLAAAALAAENDPPTLFTRGGRLVRVVEDEQGACSLELVKPAVLRGHLDRAAHWKKHKTTGELVPIAPPTSVVRDILAMAEFAPPPLADVTQTPIIGPDGTICMERGYDPATGLYYGPLPGFELPPIPDEPTEEDLASAIALLEELICDFPFDSAASVANMIALLVTPLVRHLIDGPIPLAILDKPQAGTGASLLAELVGIIATGAPAPLTSAARGDREWRKALTAMLLAGANLIAIDTGAGELRAPALAQALTTTTWTDRILGKSEMVSVPQRASWIATGRNVRLGGDLPRRCYWIRMDAQQARPWTRTGFKHPNLKEWAGENRGNLVAAVLTVVRYWIRNGRKVPDTLPRLGGFEDWRAVVGGVVTSMGKNAFLDNIAMMYEESDRETPQWQAFFQALRDQYDDHGFKASAVAKLVAEDDALKELVPDESGDPNAPTFSRKLAKGFSSRTGMRHPNGLYIEKAGMKQNAVLWTVKKEPEKP